MNVLFITLNPMYDIGGHNIYQDLLREFVKDNHRVYIVSPTEKRNNEHTRVINTLDCVVLKVRTGNVFNVGNIEKGISQITLAHYYKLAIKKYFLDVHFDLVLYSTPPITIVNAVKFIKYRDNAMTYLLLKDIFPQNAVDIGLMKTKGFSGILYKCFRRQEKELYKVSDYIGCMSQANVNYVIKHNPEVTSSHIEVCPNSIDPIDRSVNNETRIQIRRRYNIPIDKTVFVYGGNLGKPQDIPFVIKCLKMIRDASKNDKILKQSFFLVAGSGTEFEKLQLYASTADSKSFMLFHMLSKEDFDAIVASCDVGMIFLDHRFTIPNFPSRLLSYCSAKLPVLCATDINTDVGTVVVKGDFGWQCESKDPKDIVDIVENIIKKRNCLKKMGENGWNYLNQHYSAKQSYITIMNHNNR